MKQTRLQKYIADCGVTSRRKAEELILSGRVRINGHIIKTLGTKVTSEDAVMVDGNPLDLQEIKKVYLLLNKPRGYVTTLNDPEGRRTVMDLVPDISERIYPVGRLDYLSEGLLILTNDGDLANMIMHPSHEVIKVYEVKVFGIVTKEHLKQLREGISLGKRKLKPKSVRVVKQLAKKTWLEFRLGEGKNREVRKICEYAHLTVDKLKRVSIGGINIGGIAPGKYITLTKKRILKGIGALGGPPPEYFSSKKTVNLKKRQISDKTLLADARSFRRFRKDVYFETLKT